MVKKLKKLAAAGTDAQMAGSIRESAQQIWLAGLGAFSKAQEEGVKMFETLVREGENLQKKTRKVAEDRVVEITSKATGTWDRLEKVFEDRVARALHSLGVPTKQDVQTLARRVAELTTAVEELTAAEGAGAAPKAPARKRTAARKAVVAEQPAPAEGEAEAPKPAAPKSPARKRSARKAAGAQ